ncbi:MAG: TonB-dependent receptor [Nitrospinae bacterium]|nr:TonB-dependent receptor [Nitrospinota bacterium]
MPNRKISTEVSAAFVMPVIAMALTCVLAAPAVAAASSGGNGNFNYSSSGGNGNFNYVSNSGGTGNGAMLAYNTEDDSAVRELLSILDSTTELATKTRLNKDYVPGMITVLHSVDLKEQGIRTLWEAISAAPGMDISMETMGARKLNVRGATETFSSGSVKLMIDDVPVNQSYDGVASTFWKMPVEQIDRIEIVRGPGSSVHGEFAYLGVINVVTVKGASGAYAGVGSFSYANGGAAVNFRDLEKSYSLDLSVHGWRTKGADVTSGPDAISGPPYDLASTSFAPGKVSLRDEYTSGSARLRFKDFSMMFNAQEAGSGEYYGLSISLPEYSDRVAVRASMKNAEARQLVEITPSLDVELRAGWLETTNLEDTLQIVPPGFGFGGEVLYPDGWYNTNYVKERRYDGGVDVKWRGIAGHKILASATYSTAKVIETWEEINVDPVTFVQLPSMQRYEGAIALDGANDTRNVTSAAIQDEIEVTGNLALTATLRTDSYSDIGSTVNPRIAAVWHPAEGHIFKAQHATAFRPPTLFEVAKTAEDSPGYSVYPETITTNDLAYIYRTHDLMLGVNVFLSEMKNILRNYGYSYINESGATTRGAELEFEKLVGGSVKIWGNVSYAQTKDDITGESIQDSAKWLGNLSAIWKPASDFSLTGRYRVVSERQRYALDTRDALPGYETLDLTASYSGLPVKGLTLRGGVKNVFDREVKYPGMIAIFQDSVLPLQPNDLMLDGRRFWLTVEYNFAE